MSRCLFSPRSPKECILGEHLHRCQRRMSELGMPPYGRYPSDSIPPEGGAAPPPLCTPRESILSGQKSSSELLRRRVVTQVDRVEERVLSAARIEDQDLENPLAPLSDVVSCHTEHQPPA